MPLQFMAMHIYFSPSILNQSQEPKTLRMMIHIYCTIKLLLFSSNVLVIDIIVYLSFSQQLLQVKTSAMRAHKNKFMDHQIYELEEQ